MADLNTDLVGELIEAMIVFRRGASHEVHEAKVRGVVRLIARHVPVRRDPSIQADELRMWLHIIDDECRRVAQAWRVTEIGDIVQINGYDLTSVRILRKETP